MKILFDRIDQPGLNTLEVYERRGGYQSLRKALTMAPEEVLQQIVDSGIRGRGGAGFRMGQKAGFLPHGDMDKYLVCNADESEPGTFKDRELMQKSPHMLIEGILIATWAAEISRAFIYIRGEYVGPLVTDDAAQIIEDLRAGRAVLEHKQLRYRRCADPEVGEEQTDFGPPDRAQTEMADTAGLGPEGENIDRPGGPAAIEMPAEEAAEESSDGGEGDSR